MKDNIYTLLNEIDNLPESYENTQPDSFELRKWMKSFAKRTSRSKKRMKYAVAAAACICLVGASFGPVRHTVYAQVKAVTYDLAHLLGIEKDLKPYQTMVGESVSKDGITVTLNDVILDGETLLVSYTSTVPASVSEPEAQLEYQTDADVFINGRLSSVGASGSSRAVDEHNLISCLELEIPGFDLSDKLNMELSFSVQNKQIGSLEFSTSGKELSADTKTVDLNHPVSLPDGTMLTFTKYTESPVNQKIYFETSTGTCDYDIQLKGEDDLGNPVAFGIRFINEGKGRMEVSTIENGYINENARTLTLTPFAVKMPEESGKMSDDYQIVGDAFTITLPQ